MGKRLLCAVLCAAVIVSPVLSPGSVSVAAEGTGLIPVSGAGGVKLVENFSNSADAGASPVLSAGRSFSANNTDNAYKGWGFVPGTGSSVSAVDAGEYGAKQHEIPIRSGQARQDIAISLNCSGTVRANSYLDVWDIPVANITDHFNLRFEANIYFSVPQNPTGKNLLFEYQFYRRDGTTPVAVKFFSVRDDNKMMCYSANGVPEVYSGSDSSGFISGAWNHISLDIRPGSGTFDLFVNGTAVLENMAVPGEILWNGSESVSSYRIRMGNICEAQSDPHSTVIDDVLFARYEGNAPSFSFVKNNDLDGGADTQIHDLPCNIKQMVFSVDRSIDESTLRGIRLRSEDGAEKAVSASYEESAGLLVVTFYEELTSDTEYILDFGRWVAASDGTVSTEATVHVFDTADEGAQSDQVRVDGLELFSRLAENRHEKVFTLVQGDMDVNLSVINTEASSLAAVLVLAVKKNGSLVNVSVSDPRTFSPGESATFRCGIYVNDEECILEVMLFDAIDTLHPYMNRRTIRKEENIVVPDSGNPLFGVSPQAALRVNREEVPVVSEVVDGASYNTAKFSFSGTANIGIELKNGITDYQLYPKNLGISADVLAGKLWIRVDKPVNLMLSATGYAPLFLFATPLETGVPDISDEGITYLEPGVHGFTSTSFRGGEHLYFGPGIHDAGSIVMKNGMWVYLAPGAVVKGKVEGYNVSGVTVKGRGIFETMAYTQTGSAKGMLFEKSSGITVEGVGLRNAKEWQTLFLNCSNVSVSYMNLMATKVNNDGIDIDGVQDMGIYGNFIMCGDDGFGWHAVNAQRNGEPVTENIHANENVIYNVTAGNPVRIGSSMETELFRNIVIENTYAVKARGCGFLIDIQDWATLTGMRVENFYVESTPLEQAIKIQIIKGTYSSTVRDERGHVDGVYFKNFRSPCGAAKSIVLTGFDAEHMVKTITFETVKINGQLISDLSQIEMNGFVSGVSVF